jgi:SHAQKYF class myb-like DNA-binding protein
MIATGMSTNAATEAVTDGDGGKQSQHDLDTKNSANANTNRYSSSVAVTKESNVNVVEDVMMKADALAAASSASLATAAAAAACVNHSVVPDLMRVYESMTQTSSGNSPAKNNHPTNDLNALSQSASYADYLGPPHQQQQQQPYYDPNDPTGVGNSMYYNPGVGAVAQNLWGNYDTSGLSIMIPPPYAFPPQPVYNGNTIPGDHNNNNNNMDPSDQRSMADNANNITGGGRPVRAKRNVAIAALDNDPGVGYESSADGGSSGRGPNNKTRRKSSKGRNSNARSSGSAVGAGGDGKMQGNNDDKNDGRWSKRFTWPDDLHRDFVSAIFDVGLKHSSPSTVMEHMPPHEQITTERIKSHLQKYRLHRQKAKKEFMTSYQQTMEQINADGGVNNMTSLAGGQVAAHLSYVSEHHPDPDTEAVDETDGGGRSASNDMANRNEEPKFQEETSKNPSQVQQAPTVAEESTQDVFFLPKLTEAEKVSPIGISLGYLMGLFFTLRQQLEIQRHEQQEGQMHAQQQEAHHDPNQQQLFDEFATEQAGRKMSVSSLQQHPVSVQSSSRSNLEVNSLIKREMQSQMAFQNKMRALKQQELNKYSKTAGMDTNNMNNIAGTDMNSDTRQPINNDPLSQQQQMRRSNNKQHQQQEYQGAGEAGGADTSATGNREQGVSLGEEDDFWNTTVVDDELFDFLMNS